jgi:hypothetical protein
LATGRTAAVAAALTFALASAGGSAPVAEGHSSVHPMGRLPGLAPATIGTAPIAAEQEATVGSSAATPRFVGGPFAGATFHGGRPFHGAGGDELLLFAVQPGEAPDGAPGVLVASRVTGREVGEVTAPPSGWRVPLSIELFDLRRDGARTSGTFLVLDAAVQPALAGTAPGMLHEYSYSYSPTAGLETTWVSTHRFPLAGPPGPELPTGILYPLGFTRLPGGGVAVTDGLIGSIWVAGPSLEDWRLAMLDPRFAPGLGVPDLNGIGRAPDGGTRPYTMRLPSPFPGGPPAAPGIHSITYAAITDEVVTLRSAPPGGLYSLPLSALLDTAIPPYAKGGLLREVVPPQVGLSDLTDGIVYDRFHPRTRWVYWQRSVSDEVGGGSNVLRRADLLTGQVQEVARSNTLYDWTSNLAVLPPADDLPVSLVVSAMGQEENNPEVNVLLTEPNYVGPSLLTLVAVSNR